MNMEEDSHVKLEAEVGAVMPQAKECLRLEEVDRTTPLKVLKGMWPFSITP